MSMVPNYGKMTPQIMISEISPRLLSGRSKNVSLLVFSALPFSLVSFLKLIASVTNRLPLSSKLFLSCPFSVLKSLQKACLETMMRVTAADSSCPG